MTSEELKAKYGEEVVNEVTAGVEKEYQILLDQQTKEIAENNKVALEQAVKEFRKEQTPPTQEDISKMLSQEYMTYSVKVYDGKAGKEVEFTLRELPLAVERKLYTLIKEKVLPRIKDLNMISANFQNVEESAAAFFSLIDPASELLGEACAIILDPWGENKEINREWVLNNLSSSRIWNILTAQLEVNRLRDFFSGVSQTSRRGRMIPAANTRR